MKKKLVGFLIGIGLVLSVGTTFATQDIMEVMFAPTKAHENIVDLGADKQDVGDEVFRSSFVIGGETQAPLIVRITKFLLRMTVVLAVTMVLYNGVLWIVESSKGDTVKDAKNNLIYIFVGIALALLSVTLINLVSSIGVSSLDPDKVLQEKQTVAVDDKTTPPATVTPPNTDNNPCVPIPIGQKNWIKNDCDNNPNTTICQKYLSSHQQYLTQCNQQLE